MIVEIKIYILRTSTLLVLFLQIPFFWSIAWFLGMCQFVGEHFLEHPSSQHVWLVCGCMACQHPKLILVPVVTTWIFSLAIWYFARGCVRFFTLE